MSARRCPSRQAISSPKLVHVREVWGAHQIFLRQLKMAAADFRAELSRRQDLRAAGPTLGSLGKWEMEPATIHAGLDGMKCGPSPEHATEGLSPAGEHFSIFDLALSFSDFQNCPGQGFLPGA